MNTPASVNTRIKVRLIGFSRTGSFYLNKVLKVRNILIYEKPASNTIGQKWEQRRNMKNGYGLLPNDNPEIIINP